MNHSSCCFANNRTLACYKEAGLNEDFLATNGSIRQDDSALGDAPTKRKG